MAERGCEVHAFDCTVPAQNDLVRDRLFEFHQLCIGSAPIADLSSSSYAKDHAAETKNQFQFESLASIQQRLGHQSITILKFDIEGGEWDLIQVGLRDRTFADTVASVVVFAEFSAIPRGLVLVNSTLTCESCV